MNKYVAPISIAAASLLSSACSPNQDPAVRAVQSDVTEWQLPGQESETDQECLTGTATPTSLASLAMRIDSGKDDGPVVPSPLDEETPPADSPAIQPPETMPSPPAEQTQEDLDELYDGTNWTDWTDAEPVFIDELNMCANYCVINRKFGPLHEFTVTGEPAGYVDFTGEDSLFSNATIVVPAITDELYTGSNYIFAGDSGLVAYASGEINFANRTYDSGCDEFDNQDTDDLYVPVESDPAPLPTPPPTAPDKGKEFDASKPRPDDMNVYNESEETIDTIHVSESSSGSSSPAAP